MYVVHFLWFAPGGVFCGQVAGKRTRWPPFGRDDRQFVHWKHSEDIKYKYMECDVKVNNFHKGKKVCEVGWLHIDRRKVSYMKLSQRGLLCD